MERHTYLWLLFPLLGLLSPGCGKGSGPLCEEGAVTCPSGVCIRGVCEPGTGDADADGLSNADEVRIGCDPVKWDSDGDGIPDGVEVGPDPLNPKDSDGDGVPDCLESTKADKDRDCVPDQADPFDLDPHPPSDLVRSINCSRKGVCGQAFALVSVKCDAGQALCDYSYVPGYEPEEATCDGLDNDCDGDVDEGFTWHGIPIGLPCDGEGECGIGYVECLKDGSGAHCSTEPLGSMDQSREELCNGLDDDCDGETDEDLTYEGAPLGAQCDGLGECGVGVVECSPDGGVTCSTNPSGSEDQSRPEVCNGLDDDCDGETDEDAPVDGDPLAVCKPVGLCATYASKVELKCVLGKAVCDYSKVPGFAGPSEALCDNIDDDCDGQVDEDFVFVDAGGVARQVGQKCGYGACAGGRVVCSSDGLSAICSTATFATPEVCNEKDDDCDGITDNGWPKVFSPGVVVVDHGGPPPRVSPFMTACGEGRIYLFGGVGLLDPLGGPAKVLDDLWYYDLTTHRFVKVPVESPGPRAGGALLCDQERLVFVQGFGPEGEPAVDLWTLSLDLMDLEVHKVDMPWAMAIGASLVPQSRDMLVVGANPPFAYLVSLEDFSATPLNLGPLPYRSHPAIGGRGGVLYCFGGRDEKGTLRSELYRMTIEGVVEVSGFEGLPPLESAGLTVLEDGSIFIVSGRKGDGSLSDQAFLLRPDEQALKVLPLPSQVPGLLSPGLVAVGNRAYLYSGLTSDGRGFSKVMRFEGETGLWALDIVNPPPVGRAGGVLVAVPERRSLYLFGGYVRDVAVVRPAKDVFEYSTLNGEYRALQTSGPVPTFILAASAYDPKSSGIYLYGGLSGPPGEEGAEETAAFYEFDIALGGFEALPDGGEGGPGPRVGHSLVSTGKGLLLLYGGLSKGKVLGDVWGYTVGVGWFPLEGLERPRAWHYAFWDNFTGSMIVLGGEPESDVAAFNPTTRVWTTLVEHPPMKPETLMAFFDGISRTALLASPEGSLIVVLPIGGEAYWNNFPLKVEPSVWRPSVTYDPVARRALTFGGESPSGTMLSSLRAIQQTCIKP